MSFESDSNIIDYRGGDRMDQTGDQSTVHLAVLVDLGLDSHVVSGRFARPRHDGPTPAHVSCSFKEASPARNPTLAIRRDVRAGDAGRARRRSPGGRPRAIQRPRYRRHAAKGLGSPARPSNPAVSSPESIVVANPTALIRSGIMMLEHMALHAQAERVRKALDVVMTERGVRTRDVGGEASTSEFADALVAEVAAGREG